MLKKALKLDQVHAYGDLSISQFKEKMDLLIEFTVHNQLDYKQPNTQILVTVISIAQSGIFVESNEIHKKTYNRVVHQEIPVSVDFTKIYMNLSRIQWFDIRGTERSEFVSMVDLT